MRGVLGRPTDPARMTIGADTDESLQIPNHFRVRRFRRVDCGPWTPGSRTRRMGRPHHVREIRVMRKISVGMMAAVAAGMLAAGTCAVRAQQGPAEKAGEKIDRAGSRVGDALDRATDSVK